MTIADQKKFVRELAQSVVEDVIKSIDEGKIPHGFDGWDGIELRELLADKFDHERVKMDRKRKKEFKNRVIVNNI